MKLFSPYKLADLPENCHLLLQSSQTKRHVVKHWCTARSPRLLKTHRQVLNSLGSGPSRISYWDCTLTHSQSLTSLWHLPLAARHIQQYNVANFTEMQLYSVSETLISLKDAGSTCRAFVKSFVSQVQPSVSSPWRWGWCLEWEGERGGWLDLSCIENGRI